MKSSRRATLLTPTEEPMLAGLTKMGNPSWSMAASISAGEHSPSRSAMKAGCSMLWCCNICLLTTLSIHTALDKTPDPTYAILPSSSMPCTVPSSPRGPWSKGKTTHCAESDVMVCKFVGVPVVDNRPEANSSLVGVTRFQLPARLIPIVVMSYFSVLAAAMT